MVFFNKNTVEKLTKIGFPRIMMVTYLFGAILEFERK